jgi:hypothetical protein
MPPNGDRATISVSRCSHTDRQTTLSARQLHVDRSCIGTRHACCNCSGMPCIFLRSHETVAASTATARKTRYRGIRRDSGDYHHSTRHGCPLSPLGGMPNGGRFMRMPPLAGLERRNVRVRGHGPRQLPSGPPEGDPPISFRRPVGNRSSATP